MSPALARVSAAAGILFLTWLCVELRPATLRAGSDPKPEPHRSPIAMALTASGDRLLTANQTSGTVSLVDPQAGKVLDEAATGEKPAGVALSRDGSLGVVTHWYGYDVAILGLVGNRIKIRGRVEVGPEPRGVVLGPDQKTAFVAVGVSNEVVRVDLDSQRVTGRVTVGREPRGLAVSPDGTHLVAANSRERSFSVIDIKEFTVIRTLPIEGDNLRQLSMDPQGEYVLVASMKNRGFATSRNNIDQGWVLGQRIYRAKLDGSERFSALSLDPRGKAGGDAHGLAISPDGETLAVSLGGTHELMLFEMTSKPLPWREGGSRDLIPPELLREPGRFRRVVTGGRPTEIAFAPDGSSLYVANYLSDAVQVVDVEKGEVTRSIELGRPEEISLARRGEELFHDATRSFNQWYSCNTCHSDGHTNGLDFDTQNDGWQDLSTSHLRSRKKIPTLRGVTKTGPWTWHGWQKELDDAMVESFTKSMQGSRPSGEDVQAIVAYLETLEYPRNPHRGRDGQLSEAAQRGEAIYRSAKAACNTCHGGPELTDGGIHEVGLGDPRDVYKGHNPPTLKGLYDKDPFLHDGRAKTLRDTLAGDHAPELVVGGEPLSDQELSDLIEYLKTL